MLIVIKLIQTKFQPTLEPVCLIIYHNHELYIFNKKHVHLPGLCSLHRSYILCMHRLLRVLHCAKAAVVDDCLWSLDSLYAPLLPLSLKYQLLFKQENI